MHTPVTRRGPRPLVRAIGVLASLVMAALLTIAPASPASAETLNLTCLGWSTTTYEPGMTNEPQVTHITGEGTYEPCVSSDPTLTSGTFQAGGTGTVSCTGGTFAGTITFNWNNGNQSVVSYTALVGQRLLGEVVVVVEGTVTKGQFQGDAFHHTVTLFNLVPLECAGDTGVTSTSGPETIAFTDL